MKINTAFSHLHPEFVNKSKELVFSISSPPTSIPLCSFLSVPMTQLPGITQDMLPQEARKRTDHLLGLLGENQNDQSWLGRLQHTQCMGDDREPGLRLGTVLAFRTALVVSPLAAQLTSSPLFPHLYNSK